MNNRRGVSEVAAATPDRKRLDPGTGPHDFIGTLTGNELVLDGSYPEAGGTLLALYELTVNAEFTRMEGTETWTWTSDAELCHDSQSVVVANRVATN